MLRNHVVRGLLVISMSCFVKARMVEFKLLNKTDSTIEYKVGTRAHKPSPTMQLKELAAGKEATTQVDADEIPRLLVRKKGDTTEDYLSVTEFRPDAGTKMIAVRVTELNPTRVEPQTKLKLAIKGNITLDETYPLVFWDL